MQSWVFRGLLASGIVSTAIAGTAMLPAAAEAAGTTIYVSPGGSASHHGGSCRDAVFSSVQAAVSSAPAGGTVVVCRGTYHESVTVDKKLRLVGRLGSVIDAKGYTYGVGVAADWVTVAGLTVENADDTSSGPADGILTAGFGPRGPVAADHVVIRGNLTRNNKGAGIDLNSTSWSVAAHNISKNNGIGVNVSDDLGIPASHNRISNNVASDNPGGCGIVLADHTGVGVFANVVEANTANRNGLGTPSAPNASSGSGIILAGSSGGVWDNVVRANFFYGNGHAGVALHAHAPGLNFSGNRIIDNVIGKNNLRTDFQDLETTGIYLADASDLTITVANNTIHDDHFGVFTAGNVTLKGFASNHFFRVAKRLGSFPTY